MHSVTQGAACLVEAALADRAFIRTMMRCPSLAEAEGESEPPELMISTHAPSWMFLV